jgi:hypothetical protein
VPVGRPGIPRPRFCGLDAVFAHAYDTRKGLTLPRTQDGDLVSRLRADVSSWRVRRTPPERYQPSWGRGECLTRGAAGLPEIRHRRGFRCLVGVLVRTIFLPFLVGGVSSGRGFARAGILTALINRSA